MFKTINDTPALCFDDVLISPSNVTTVKSRSDIDLTVELQGIDKFNKLTCDYPLMSSPMDTVTGTLMAAKLADMKCLSYLPRYNTPETQAKEWEEATGGTANGQYVGVAIGCQEADHNRFKLLYEAGCRSFCVDVANGHMVALREFLETLTSHEDIFVISGNTATGMGYKNLSDIGISGVRVGIGGGAGCTTRIQTGVGYPLLESLSESDDRKSLWGNDAAIIADGGIRNSGDAAKALVFSDFVMLGSLLAACEESPGGIVTDEHGVAHKLYRGMASLEAQQSRPGMDQNRVIVPEGAAGLIPLGKPVEQFIKEFFGGVASAMSYSDSHTIQEFHAKARLAIVSQSTIGESNPRVK